MATGDGGSGGGWRWRLPMAAAAATDTASGRLLAACWWTFCWWRPTPSPLLVEGNSAAAGRFAGGGRLLPLAGGGRWRSDGLRRRLLASVAAATATVTVEAGGCRAKAQSWKPSLGSFESRRTAARFSVASLLEDVWRSVTLSGVRSGVSLLLGLCVGDVSVWVAV
uniref:Uncharacterized protein n=1 Tax=Oryza rufipogon TaxID=4529 RepID=A0A0E0R204_ORYRU